jgi:hypothetical protein
MVIQHALFETEDYPLFRLMHEIIQDPVDVRGRLMEFIETYFAG